jgi:hypothetical protein
MDLSPFLYIGIILAVFHALGKTPCFKDKLKSSANGDERLMDILLTVHLKGHLGRLP